MNPSELPNSETPNNDSHSNLSDLSNEECDNASIHARMEYMAMEIVCKDSVNSSLKETITAQHCELQVQQIKVAQLTGHVTSLENDIHTLKISENWYKVELHRCQQQKSEYHRRCFALEIEKCQAIKHRDSVQNKFQSL